uniref:Protein kinase domain-containing protein n=1 Tax=Chenopodium quinoa TaxID=63459 RepID=A0A803N519_CHEQI
MLHLLLTVALLLSSATTTTSSRECPPCGTTRVPYPLSTAPSCGDQDYKIQCNNSTLLFPTSNNTYPITSITPNNQRLIIAPSPFLPNTCITSDISSQGVQLNQTAPFNVTGDNTIMFLNCSQSLLGSPLNCSSNSLCHVYVNSTREASACVRVRLFVVLFVLGVERRRILFGSGKREPVCRTQADCAVDGENSTCRADINSVGTSRCYCNSALHWDGVNGICSQNYVCEKQGGCDDSNKAALIAGLVSGIGGAFILATIVAMYYKRQRRIKEAQDRLKKEREEVLNSGGGRTAKIFSGREIKKATNHFSRDRLLGSGGYGDVYKGTLYDGTLTAVKCAKVGNAKGTDQILNEVRILCQVNHKSLVRLLGCCVELEQPIMVYEYISNGTLYDHLHGHKPGGYSRLTWSHRLRVAYHTAEALAYLHFSANPNIYHRDVKSSNILLDEKLNAKVSDFGLSRLAETDMSHISTCAQGTLGYLDPEYYRNYQLTDKSDVYSFGVVLLELLTSQKAIDFNREADDVNLAMYVKRLVDEEQMLDAVDPLLKEGASTMEIDTMKALGFLAIGCLEERRQNRPSMKEIAEEIEYIISIATAKKS